MKAGQTWNESRVYADPLSGRRVRQLTCRGCLNHTPTYHTGGGFTADGRCLVFVSVREGATWVVRGEASTGDLEAIWQAPGIGDRSYLHRGMGLSGEDVDGRGISGNRVCLAPRSRLAVFTCERQLLAVPLAGGEKRVLLNDCGDEWIYGTPSVSADEQWVAICLSSTHPEWAAGRPLVRSYLSIPDHRLRVIRVPLGGRGEAEVLFERAPAQSAHCAFSPVDPNLLYFDLDLPPRYWCGSDGTTPRIWLLDLRHGVARPLKLSYPGPFQTHQAWLWDGSGMAYHGPLPGGGVYIGVTSVDGTTVWERCYPEARSYGHVSVDPVRRALILDGDFTDDRLQWLHYGNGEERLQTICRHGTEWESMPGQYTHPHPLADPTGRWICFNAAHGGQSNVFIVSLDG